MTAPRDPQFQGQSDPLTLYRKLTENPIVSSFQVVDKNQFGDMVYSRPNYTVSNLATQIGFAAAASGNRSSAYGAFAQAREDGAVALGVYAQAGPNAIAIGDQSRARAAQTMAFGLATLADHPYAIVFSGQSTAVHQFRIGPKHIEMTRVTTTVGVSAPNDGRLYFDLNGSNKMRLNVQFPTGAAIVLATEV